MSAKDSRLALLMDAFGVSGRKLATALHVDYSLVSKWRTNKRPLSPGSAHTRCIARFFWQYERENNLSVLQNLLLTWDNKFDPGDEEGSILSLSRWLVEEPLADQFGRGFALAGQGGGNFTTVNHLIYEGNEGRRQACLHLLNTLLLLPPGQRLLWFSQEDSGWLLEDHAYFVTWRGKMLQVLEAGHSLYIHLWVSECQAAMASMLRRWIPVSLSGNVEFSYEVRPTGEAGLYSIVLLEGYAGIFSMIPAQDADRFTTIFTDSITLKAMTHRFHSAVDNSRHLFTAYTALEVATVMERVRRLSQPSKRSYFYASLPIGTVDILLRHGMIDRPMLLQMEEGGFLAGPRFGQGPPDSSAIREMACLPQVENALLQREVFFPTLSVMTGRKVFLTAEQYRAYLYEIAQRLRESPYWEFGLLPRELMDAPRAGIWTNAESVAALWLTHPDCRILTMQDPVMISALVSGLDSDWNSIPRPLRERGSVIALLEKMSRTALPK